jgi:hypothetical protein
VIGERGIDSNELEYRSRHAEENESIPLAGAAQMILSRLSRG